SVGLVFFGGRFMAGDFGAGAGAAATATGAGENASAGNGGRSRASRGPEDGSALVTSGPEPRPILVSSSSRTVSWTIAPQVKQIEREGASSRLHTGQFI